jgi:hypothetical protein
VHPELHRLAHPALWFLFCNGLFGDVPLRRLFDLLPFWRGFSSITFGGVELVGCRLIAASKSLTLFLALLMTVDTVLSVEST